MDFVFDFDGTLVDSAPAIRQCLAAAAESVAPECVARALAATIGPPLGSMAKLILGDASPARQRSFVETFMRLYDEHAVASTRAYAGATLALRDLAASGAQLALLTNKREHPTLRILEALGWSGLFMAVRCTDSAGCSGLDKGSRLAALLPGLRASDCAMVGDTLEDYRAAVSNHVAFVAADYGYETDRAAFAGIPAIQRMAQPQDLLRLAALRSTRGGAAGGHSSAREAEQGR